MPQEPITIKGQADLDALVDVTPSLPIRFSTVAEGTKWLEDYREGKNPRIPFFVAGIPAYKTEGFRTFLNPDYRDAKCEIRLFTKDGKNGYAAVFDLSFPSVS